MKQFLILSQEITVVETFEKCLEREPFSKKITASFVEDEWEALREIKRENVIGILYDHQLEKMSGFEFSLLIKEGLKDKKMTEKFKEIVYIDNEEEQKIFKQRLEDLLSEKSNISLFPLTNVQENLAYCIKGE